MSDDESRADAPRTDWEEQAPRDDSETAANSRMPANSRTPADPETAADSSTAAADGGTTEGASSSVNGGAADGPTTASDVLARSLEIEGVDHVFGVPGEETEAMVFSLRDSDVTFVPVRHEQGAAFMADVHGRLTGDAGVCLSTLGPGATNLLTGVADAHLDKSPLVAITGQGGLERLHRESHQAIDVVETFESVTKWNAQLDDPDIVHEAARKAFKLAEHEKPGATHLELPEDVAYQETEVQSLEGIEPVPGSRPNEDAIDRVCTLFENAERPLIVAGNGTVRTNAWRELRQLVANADVPVVSTYMGKGAISDDNPRSLMTLDSGDGAASAAIDEADLLVTVGYDIAEHDPDDWTEDDGTPIVHVDSEPAEVHAAYVPEVEVVADVELALRELVDRVLDEADFHPDWFTEYRERVEASVANDGEPEPPFSVASVLPVLREMLDPEDVLVSDVGQHKLEIARRFPTFQPNTCIVSNGFASMGISVPGGVAADLAVDADVVSATGDGGFLMNAAELETATRLGCSYTVVVFRDDDYRMISAQQQASRDEQFGTGLTNPDLQTFAESFGIDAYRPESCQELREALSSIRDDSVSLVEIPVEYEVATGDDQ